MANTGEGERSKEESNHNLVRDFERFYRRNNFWSLISLACMGACLVALTPFRVNSSLWTSISAMGAAYSFLYIANMFRRAALIAKCGSWRIQMAQTPEERLAAADELMKMMQRDIYSMRLQQPDGPRWLGIVQGILTKKSDDDKK